MASGLSSLELLLTDLKRGTEAKVPDPNQINHYATCKGNLRVVFSCKRLLC